MALVKGELDFVIGIPRIGNYVCTQLLTFVDFCFLDMQLAE